MKKKLPRLRSDAEAEAFVDERAGHEIGDSRGRRAGAQEHDVEIRELQAGDAGR